MRPLRVFQKILRILASLVLWLGVPALPGLLVTASDSRPSELLAVIIYLALMAIEVYVARWSFTTLIWLVIPIVCLFVSLPLSFAVVDAVLDRAGIQRLRRNRLTEG